MRTILLFFLLVTSAATAQVTDNFTDGNFTSNPVWSGDATEFIVNSSQQLQTNNTVTGSSYLSATSPVSSLNNIEWRFYIKQSFAPSSSNYGRVYLASDQANLEGSLNGYYLQFGESGSSDAVELFRQSGVTSTSLIRGTNGEIANSFAIGVKVMRDALGNWSLYIDPLGGNSYTLEISGFDNTFTTTAFFGVAAVYTSSNATKFYFDDFYNGAVVVDNMPPVIVSSSVISTTQLDVIFNESVDLVTSQTLTNYNATNGLGNPIAATRDAGNLSLVHLTFATPFTSGLANTLSVTNVKDLNGNAITTATTNFTYAAAAAASYKDIIINEIYADFNPVVGLPAAEFIELYNRSTQTYNLSGWKFSDASGSSTSTFGNYYLAPNQYLIVCKAADTALFASFGNHLGVSSFPSLNDSGDNLELIGNTLAVIDSVNYSDSWYQDATKKNGGWTLELINPNSGSYCSLSSNWIASNNATGGTPGIQNSVYSIAIDITAPTILSVSATNPTHITVNFSEGIDPSVIMLLTNYSISNGIGTPTGAIANSTLTSVDLTLSPALLSSSSYTLSLTNISDCSGNALNPATAIFSYNTVKPFDVVINEIMADPDPIVGLPDFEYVELYNRTAFPINLNNWLFTTGTSTKVITNATIQSHGYIILTSGAGALYFASTIPITTFSSLALTNGGQTLVLKSPQESVISTVSYSDQWYQDATKVNGGWSLEQIDPNNPCAGMNNWHASTNSSGGTPGTLNAVNAVNTDNIPPQVVRVGVIAADTIQLYFNEPLDSTTMLNASIYSINYGIGAPSLVKVIGPDFKSVRLNLSSALQVGTIYNITVNNTITDCVGNAIGADNTARFALPQPAIANDIVINEILFDPKAEGVDFVEIYNRSGKVIDLKTLTLSQYDTLNNITINDENITEDGYLLFPQSYIVLSENGNAVKSQYNTSNPEGFLDMGNLPSMNNDGGTICLSGAGIIIDNFKYYADMHLGLLNITKGISLERIDFNNPTQDRNNWHSAAATVGYATPAYKNSQYKDAGVTNNAIEIIPEIFSPDEDGNNDFVNINFHFDTPGFTANITIYDSKGRIVKQLVRNELLGINGTYRWDGINDDRDKARIGIYIIFFEVFDLKGNVEQYKKTCVLGGKLN